MAPDLNLLFHPKKKNGVVVKTAGSPTKKKVTRPPPPKPVEAAPVQEERPKLPDGVYQEFKVMSVDAQGWNYDYMKFDDRRKVDPRQWQEPVKMNRKEVRRRDDGTESSGPQAVGPMLGPDGKPVIGMDGRMVMVDAEGRPIHNTPRDRGQDGGGRGGRGRGGRKFQKKTRQVFLVPDEVRQLRREERYPWVLEDASGTESWQGSMEEVSKSETHAILIPSPNSVFNFVPIHRWYKYHKKPSHKVMDLEEAEALMTKIQKNKEPVQWLSGRKNASTSDSTKALFKTEGGGASSQPSGSQGPGGRRLRTVDSGTNELFGDDEEDGDGARRRREREMGRDGDMEEVDFKDVFEDDEQTMEVDDNEDEEAKDLERRLEREYANLDKGREGSVVSDAEDDDGNQLTKAGKGIKKLLRKQGGPDDEDSDEERNPYASSEESSDEEEVPPTQESPATQSPASTTPSASQSQDVKPPTTPSLPSQTPPAKASSRAASPAAPTLGGHSVVAKRATSSKVPRPKGASGSRATSPLAGGSGSRATSPAASRASSPSIGSAAGSKRKADEDGSGSAPKPKKYKPSGLTAKALIEWLDATPSPTTRDCIGAFAAYVRDDNAKKRFTKLVKELAMVKDGFLVLRPGARDTAAASTE